MIDGHIGALFWPDTFDWDTFFLGIKNSTVPTLTDPCLPCCDNLLEVGTARPPSLDLWFELIQFTPYFIQNRLVDHLFLGNTHGCGHDRKDIGPARAIVYCHPSFVFGIPEDLPGVGFLLDLIGIIEHDHPVNDVWRGHVRGFPHFWNNFSKIGHFAFRYLLPKPQLFSLYDVGCIGCKHIQLNFASLHHLIDSGDFTPRSGYGDDLDTSFFSELGKNVVFEVLLPVASILLSVDHLFCRRNISEEKGTGRQHGCHSGCSSCL